MRTKSFVLEGNFLWAWCETWFIEAKDGNYVWSDPDYPDGTNVAAKYDGNLEQFLKERKIDFVRDKGHQVRTVLLAEQKGTV
jgi:hypothetical protein